MSMAQAYNTQGAHVTDFDKDWFQAAWPTGYSTSVGILKLIGLNADDITRQYIDPHAGPTRAALEIGPGAGFWSRLLLPRFGRVLLADVIPTPPEFTRRCGSLVDAPHATWLELESQQYDLEPVADHSVDYVWCFGVMCHLSLSAQRQYLQSIVCKAAPGCQCLIMFANWKRHPQYKDVVVTGDPEDIRRSAWFYNDLEITTELLTQAGFDIVCVDTYPEARDTLAHVQVQ